MRTLQELTARVEAGLTKWPDGTHARCAMNNEAYTTYALAYVVDGKTTDDDLIESMMEQLFAIKSAIGAKFISWRAPFTLQEYREPIKVHKEQDQLPSLINPPVIRTLRCRVLITALAAKQSDEPE